MNEELIKILFCWTFKKISMPPANAESEQNTSQVFRVHHPLGGGEVVIKINGTGTTIFSFWKVSLIL